MKTLLGVTLLFLGIIARGVSQEVVAAAPRLDTSPAEGKHETIKEAGIETLRRNAPQDSLHRLQQRPFRPTGRRLKSSSTDKGHSSPRLSTRQERIQKYFRQAAQRRFALGLVLPRRRGDTSNAGIPSPPPPRPLEATPRREGGHRDAQERKLTGIPRDAAKVAEEHVKEAPRLLVTKFHGPIKATQDSSLSRGQGFQPDLVMGEKDRGSLDQGQLLSDKDENDNDGNSEALAAQIAQQPAEAPQATFTKSDSEQEKTSLQNINLPAAGGGVPRIRERVRLQGVRPRFRLGDDESGERGERRGISPSLRRRRLRILRPNFRIQRKGPRLVARQNPPLEFQDHRQSEIYQQPSLSEDLEHSGDKPLTPHSFSTAGEESFVRQQPQHVQAQAPHTYLPRETQGSDDITSHVQHQDGDTPRAATGPETTRKVVFDLQEEDIQMELRQQSHTQALLDERVESEDSHITAERQHHSALPERQRTATHSIPADHSQIQHESADLPETISPLMDVSPQDLATTSSTSHQEPSVPSEALSPTSFDDSFDEHSADQEQYLPKINNLQRLSARQQEIGKRRLSQRLQSSSPGVPRVRTFIRHRFSQNTQRASQPQRLKPVRQPQTENFPILQTPQAVVSNFPRNDSSQPHILHEPKIESHSPARLSQSEHLTQETEDFTLHFAQPRHRFSDLSSQGAVTGTKEEPLLKSVTLRIHRPDSRPQTSSDSLGQQESRGIPLGGNRKGLEQQEELHDRHLPIAFGTHKQNENIHSSFPSDHFPAIPQHQSVGVRERQSEGTSRPTAHEHHHHQHDTTHSIAHQQQQHQHATLQSTAHQQQQHQQATLQSTAHQQQQHQQATLQSTAHQQQQHQHSTLQSTAHQQQQHQHSTLQSTAHQQQQHQHSTLQSTAHQQQQHQHSTLQSTAHQQQQHQHSTLQSTTHQQQQHQHSTLQSTAHQQQQHQHATLQSTTHQQQQHQHSTLQSTAHQQQQHQHSTLQSTAHQQHQHDSQRPTTHHHQPHHHHTPLQSSTHQQQHHHQHHAHHQQQQQQQQQHASLSHTHLDDHHYNTHLTLPHEESQIGDTEEPLLDTHTPRQPDPHTTLREHSPTQGGSGGNNLVQSKDDTGMTTDDVRYLGGVAVASLLSGEHMGLKHASLHHDNVKPLTRDDGVFRATSDGRLTAAGHAHTEGTQRKHSDPRQKQPEFPPLHSTTDVRGVRVSQGSHLRQSDVVESQVPYLRHSSVAENQAPHLRQSGVTESQVPHSRQSSVGESQATLLQKADVVDSHALQLRQPGVAQSQTENLRQSAVTENQAPRLEQSGVTQSQTPHLRQSGVTESQTLHPRQFDVTKSEKPHLQQSGVADSDSSRKSDDTTIYGSDNHPSHADAYLSHLKKLESELERHVSRIRGGTASFRKVEAFRQGDSRPRTTGEQGSSYRQSGAIVRGTQPSRSHTDDERVTISNFRDGTSRMRGSGQSNESRNEIRIRNQLSSPTEARDGEVRLFQSGRSGQVDPLQEKTQKATAPALPMSRVWRQQNKLLPIRISSITGQPAKPHLMQRQNPEAWRPPPIRRPSPIQGEISVLQSSRSEKTTFQDINEAPRAQTNFLTSVQTAPRRGTASSEQARQQFTALERSQAPLHVPLSFREGRQRQVLSTSRRLTNSHGQPAYTFHRSSDDGAFQENLFRHGDYYSPPRQLGRLREPQQVSIIHQEEARAGVSSRSHDGTSRGSLTGFAQAVRDVALTPNPDQRHRQQHRGSKSFWDSVEGSYKPVTQRGSRKFMDTLRNMNEGMEQETLLKSLSVLLRGEDFAGSWSIQDTPNQGSQRPQDIQIPQTGFTCKGLASGYYADTHEDARCSSFHFCGADGTHTSYMCPTGTAFSQRLQVCDHAFRVECRVPRRADHHHHDHQHDHQQTTADTSRKRDRFGKRVASQDLYHLRQRA